VERQRRWHGCAPGLLELGMRRRARNDGAPGLLELRMRRRAKLELDLIGYGDLETTGVAEPKHKTCRKGRTTATDTKGHRQLRLQECRRRNRLAVKNNRTEGRTIGDRHKAIASRHDLSQTSRDK
jgi:hypothetical protein